MTETIRCFIAIELSPEIKSALLKIEDDLKPKLPGVKWVHPENIHLTLKFLGHIRSDMLERIKIIANETAYSTRPFAIRLSSAGTFPSIASPRVIWVGIDNGNKESAILAGCIEEKAATLGIEKENRPFHPHLTLGRVDFLKDKTALKTAFSSLKIPPIEMMASKITLFQSTLARSGAIYNVLQEYRLSHAP